jgi:hypothetical protein
VKGDDVKRFAPWFLISTLILIILSCGNETPKGRPFLMGFSAAPHERTPDGKKQAKYFLSENSELVLEDFSEGVPWEEAFRGEPLPEAVDVSLRIRKRTLEGKSLILHVSPFDLKRANAAEYWPNTTEVFVQERWRGRSFGDRDLEVAYLRFCLELIRQFRPRYVAYAVDVNYFAAERPEEWKSFVNFAREVYRGIKAQYPELPVFVTFDACSFWKDQEVQEKRIREILPYTDFLAVTAYPHLAGFGDVEKLPKDFFSRLAEIGAPKAFAVADTGFPNPLRGNNTIDKDSQKRYLEFVLQESHKLRAKFVVWFHYRDFGKVLEEPKSKARAPELINLFELRKNYGLVDDAGKSKNSHAVWKRWFQLPTVNKKSDPA